jgi:hypothetical protein
MSAVDAGPSTAPLISQPQSREPSQPPASRLDVPPSTAQETPVSPIPEAGFSHDVPQSQPMTATASASSQNPTQDDADGNSAAPYGTRSRNRPGGARPNYADDKELDMEIEAAGRIKAAPKKVASTAPPTAEPATTSFGFAAINSVSTQNNDPPAPVNVAPPQPAPAKKRKQPASSNPTSNGTAPSYNSGPRARALLSTAYVETNMMSFSRCGQKLNNKKQLVADDGTTLAANGK